jgi:hypothetical protein
MPATAEEMDATLKRDLKKKQSQIPNAPSVASGK